MKFRDVRASVNNFFTIAIILSKQRQQKSRDIIQKLSQHAGPNTTTKMLMDFFALLLSRGRGRLDGGDDKISRRLSFMKTIFMPILLPFPNDSSNVSAKLPSLCRGKRKKRKSENFRARFAQKSFVWH